MRVNRNIPLDTIVALNSIKPLDTNDILGDMDRVKEYPKLMIAEARRVSGAKLNYSNRIRTSFEWLLSGGIEMGALFVDEDTFEILVEEFLFAHPGSQIEKDCNCVILPSQDGTHQLPVFKKDKVKE